MEFFWPVVYYLIPGMLLGFGFAVYPHRERLGSACAPTGQRLWQVLPGTAMCWGWLLMLASLMLQRVGELLAVSGGRILIWCLTLDALGLGAGLLLLAEEERSAALRG